MANKKKKTVNKKIHIKPNVKLLGVFLLLVIILGLIFMNLAFTGILVLGLLLIIWFSKIMGKNCN